MIEFLILYEDKARELENCVYLRNNLQKRGYKVSIASMLSLEKMTCKPKVVVTPHLYDDDQVAFYTCSIWPNRRVKVISMQYEQVLNRKGRESGVHRPKGSAINAFHIAWGDNEEREYLSSGIRPNHILKIGSIGLDLDTDGFRHSLMNRMQLEKLYGIKQNQLLNVFFSSFAYCGRSEENLKAIDVDGTTLRLYKIMEKTKPIVLNWFDSALEKYESLVIVYRAHPAETIGESLDGLIRKYPERFLVINDYSIRHWINVADYCNTWFSTSSIDAFYAGKYCSLLRPYKLDEDLELETMYGAKTINNETDFLSQFNNSQKIDSSIIDNMSKFFVNKQNELVIDNYCNAFVDVLNNNEPDALFKSHFNSFRSYLVTIFMALLCSICKHVKISSLFSLFSKRLGVALRYYEKEVYGQKESIDSVNFMLKNHTC